MAKTRVRKETEVRDYKAGLGNTQTVVLADLSLLKANEMNVFRREAEKQNVGVRNVKKTLLALALKEAGLDVVDVKALAGTITVMTCPDDVVLPAKVVETVRKVNDKVKFIGGIMEGKWLDQAAIETLAKTPTRKELLGMLVGVLQGNIGNFVRALGAVKEAKASA